MTDVSQAHDSFFRHTFSQPEAARDFLANYLPPEIVALLDLATLEPQPDSFVDAALKRHISDLLYRVNLRTGQPAFVYLLFEHKSSIDLQTPFQLLRYMVRIWERVRSHRSCRAPATDHPPGDSTTAPSVGPLQPNFMALFTGPDELRRFWPKFDFQLHDLGRLADDEIKGAAMVRAAVLALRVVFDPAVREQLPVVVELLRQTVRWPEETEFLYAVLQYLVTSAPSVQDEDVRAALKNAFPNEAEVMMNTLAERWIEQGRAVGREEGREVGREEGAIHTVLNLLQHRFGPISPDLSAQIQQLPSLIWIAWSRWLWTHRR